MKLFGRKKEETAPSFADVEEPNEIAGALTPAQTRALEALRRDGIAIVPFAELVGDDSLWRELAGDVERFVESAKARIKADLAAPTQKDDFLIRRYRAGKAAADAPGEDARFATGSPWLRLAVDSGILDIVNTYRGRATKVVDIDQWYTVPFQTDHDRVASQRWHRDPEDQHVVKVFVYYSDVDTGSGPFQYVRGSAEGGRYGDLWPWGETDWYPPQDEFEAKIPAEERVTATGPVGTVIICDTSGFHRGGFAETSPRILGYHTYVSTTSEQRRKFTVDWGGADGLTERARYALA